MFCSIQDESTKTTKCLCPPPVKHGRFTFWHLGYAGKDGCMATTDFNMATAISLTTNCQGDEDCKGVQHASCVTIFRNQSILTACVCDNTTFVACGGTTCVPLTRLQLIVVDKKTDDIKASENCSSDSDCPALVPGSDRCLGWRLPNDFENCQCSCGTGTYTARDQSSCVRSNSVTMETCQKDSDCSSGERCVWPGFRWHLDEDEENENFSSTVCALQQDKDKDDFISNIGSKHLVEVVVGGVVAVSVLAVCCLCLVARRVWSKKNVQANSQLQLQVQVIPKTGSTASITSLKIAEMKERQKKRRAEKKLSASKMSNTKRPSSTGRPEQTSSNLSMQSSDMDSSVDITESDSSFTLSEASDYSMYSQ
jgi:hypothetical protein